MKIRTLLFGLPLCALLAGCETDEVPGPDG